MKENQGEILKEKRKEIIEKKKRDSQQRYYWLKEHKICVSCAQADAMPGRVRCPDCLYKSNEASIKRNRQTYSIQKEKIKTKKKEKYRKRKEAGLCVRCGKLVYKKYAMCYECLIKDRRKVERYRKKKREESGIFYDDYRQYRLENGLCYFCGKPVVEGKKVCEVHYKQNVEKINKMRKIIERKKTHV